ncbi:MAG: hypothetical protein LBP56_07910, partial [Odoribacteraceae bacterium]|nr:hypothetical protein [Odoribacteraceae bacterium]
ASSDYLPHSEKLFLSWVVNFLKSLSPLVGQVGFPVDKYQGDVGRKIFRPRVLTSSVDPR